MVSQPSSKDEKPKKRKSPKRRAIIIAVVIFIIIVGGAFSVELTSQTWFCKSCHEMEEFHTAWESSSHNSVDCIDCHSDPGFVGLMEAKANGLRQAVVHFTGVPDTITAEAEKINCINCHQDKPRTNLELAAVDKDPHTAAHFTEMNCVTCHTGLTHDNNMNKSRPTRDSCFTCHLEEMNL